MAFLNDELLAKRLQDLERSEEQARRDSRLRDEEIARQLANQFLSEDQNAQNSSSFHSEHAPVTIHTGQKASIRLHNPATGSLIGEVFDAKYIDQYTMAFELKQRPGLRLRVSDKGKVEFSDTTDPTTLFSIELISPTGPMYIICKAHASKFNVNSEPIWYLSLNNDNQLIGNGGRGALSQWVLVAAGEDGRSATPSSPRQYQSVLPSNFNYDNSAALASASAAERQTTTTTVVSTVVEKPEFNRDEATIAALMAWLATPAGQLYLSELSHYARTMYADGTLKRILYRPDWPRVAERWKDYARFSYPVNRGFAEQYLTRPLRQQFFEQGFCVIQDVIPPHLLNNAYRLALFWAGRYPSDATVIRVDERAGCKVEMAGPFSTDCDFLALFYETAIVQVVEFLIGEGECTAPQLAELSLSYPSLLDPPSIFDGSGWVIDGFTETGDHTPYSLLIGVALTDLDNYCGSVCVFPTSHYLLREYVVQEVVNKSCIYSSPHQHPQKPYLNNCSQLVLKAGDVFLCTQKLARQDVVNTSDAITAVVYFKVSNINHEFLKGSALEAVWTEFKGAAEFVNVVTSSPVHAAPGPYGAASNGPRGGGTPSPRDNQMSPEYAGGSSQRRFFNEDSHYAQLQQQVQLQQQPVHPQHYQQQYQQQQQQQYQQPPVTSTNTRSFRTSLPRTSSGSSVDFTNYNNSISSSNSVNVTSGPPPPSLSRTPSGNMTDFGLATNRYPAATASSGGLSRTGSFRQQQLVPPPPPASQARPLSRPNSKLDLFP